MSLEYAILGFLNYQPFSGYDLKKLFDTSVRHFWPADQSQIYRTLARLTEQGLVELEVVEQTDRPDRKVYHITKTGQESLHQWLQGPAPVEEARSAPLIQVFFAGQLTDEEIVAKFEELAGVLRGALASYNQVPGRVGEYVEMVNSPRETFFWMLTLDMGITVAEAQLKWVEGVIQRIKNKEHPAL
jgi:DNA-binding PadR family transcriptional regulator